MLALVKNVWIHGFLGRSERTFKVTPINLGDYYTYRLTTKVIRLLQELPSYVDEYVQRSYEGKVVLDRVLYDYKSKGCVGRIMDVLDLRLIVSIC